MIRAASLLSYKSDPPSLRYKTHYISRVSPEEERSVDVSDVPCSSLSSMNSSILRLLTRRYAIANSALATLSRHLVHCSQRLSHFFSPSRKTRGARKIDDARRQQSHDSIDVISREACSELCVISLTSIHPYRGSFLVDQSIDLLSPLPSSTRDIRNTLQEEHCLSDTRIQIEGTMRTSKIRIRKVFASWIASRKSSGASPASATTAEDARARRDVLEMQKMQSMRYHAYIK